MIAITGRGGKSGSFQIRAEQLGLAAGLKIVPNAQDIVAGKFELIVIVKRPRAEALEHLRKIHVPISWDVIDAWPQPIGNLWNRDQCMRWLRAEIATMKPNAIVVSTAVQAYDAAEFGLPSLVLPHHTRPWQARNPIRERVRLVGYEGGKQYIVQWQPIIEAECARRGWKFVMNPSALSDVDIVVALRDQTGHAARCWKSNVKLANAQGTGTPVVCNRESGYLENACGAEQWADNPKELSAAFEALVDHGTRKRASIELFKAAPTLERIASEYSAWLNFIAKHAASQPKGSACLQLKF